MLNRYHRAHSISQKHLFDPIGTHETGKGEQQTFWLEVKGGRFSVQGSAHDDSSANHFANEDELLQIARDKKQNDKKIDRLIDWNVGVLSNLIKQIIARRRGKGLPDYNWGTNFDGKLALTRGGGTVLDEVREIISLPDFDDKAVYGELDHESIELRDEVVTQLREYVRCVAMLYNDNPCEFFW